MLELKDHRLYSEKEVKKNLLEKIEEARKFQHNEKDKPLFKESFNQIEPDGLTQNELEVLNLKVGVADCCCGRRDYMEDAHFAREIVFVVQEKEYKASLVDVFDGHGCDACSKHLSTHIEKAFVDRLQEHNRENLNETNIFNAMKVVFVDLSKNYPGENDGANATAVLVTDSIAFVADVSDSRALIENNGESTTLSVDAKPQAQKFRQGIEQRGGNVIFSRGVYRVGSLISLARTVGQKTLQE